MTNNTTAHQDALKLVHEEAGRTLSKSDFDLCMRIAKRAILAAPRAASVSALDRARDLLAALIDIMDDEQNNAPEDRCYAEGAWNEAIAEARAMLNPAPAAPVAELVVAMPGERAVIDMLLALARATFRALDDSEEIVGVDGHLRGYHGIDSANFDAVSNALDALDDLPDDKPGYALDAGGKAEWALRNLGIAQTVAADGARLDQQTAMEAGWMKHSGEPWYGGAGVTRGIWDEAWQQGAGWMDARAAVSTATAEDQLCLNGEPWNPNPDGITPGEESAPRVNQDTGMWEGVNEGGLDFEPDAQHAVADMANIGYALMQTIERMVPGYRWNESPTEIVSDLVNERDEARASQAAAPADARKTITKERIAVLVAEHYDHGPRSIYEALAGLYIAPADAGEAALTAAARDVLAERARQVSAEGWTLDNDDLRRDQGQLSYAAAGLARLASDAATDIVCGTTGGLTYADECVGPPEPWPHGWIYKPATPRRNLVKAAALAIAEIERIDRAQGAQSEGGDRG